MFAFDFKNFSIYFFAHLFFSEKVSFSYSLSQWHWWMPHRWTRKSKMDLQTLLLIRGRETKTYVYPKRYKKLPKREEKKKNPLNFLSFFLLFVCSCLRNDVRAGDGNFWKFLKFKSTWIKYSIQNSKLENIKKCF
jgi:hypothetical protein